EILERGMREFPYDQELWTSSGQFLAYLAPQYLHDPALAAEWKLDGARVLARACELVSSNANLPHHCLTAASIFARAGLRDTNISMLERLLAVTDDPEIREEVQKNLDALEGGARRERRMTHDRHFLDAWGKDLSFVSKDSILVVGPRFDVAHCAGK